jgi:hypothetical protein
LAAPAEGHSTFCISPTAASNVPWRSAAPSSRLQRPPSRPRFPLTAFCICMGKKPRFDSLGSTHWLKAPTAWTTGLAGPANLDCRVLCLPASCLFASSGKPSRLRSPSMLSMLYMHCSGSGSSHNPEGAWPSEFQGRVPSMAQLLKTSDASALFVATYEPTRLAPTQPSQAHHLLSNDVVPRLPPHRKVSSYKCQV